MPLITRTINSASGDNISYYYDSNTGASYTPSIINSYVHDKIIFPRYKINILNADESVREEIPQEFIQLGGSYNENYQNGQRRSLSFSLINENGEFTPRSGHFWEGTKLSLETGLQVPNSDTVIWFKKGVYSISSANPSRSTEKKEVAIESADKFSILEGKRGTIPETIEIEAGQDIGSIISDILGQDMGNGEVLDPKPFIYHSSFVGRTLPIKLSASAGSTWGALIIQIAEILSAEVFYNADGNLTFIPITEVVQDADKPVVFEYQEDEFQSEGFQLPYNNYVNKIYVVGANVNGHLCTAVSENRDPASPINIQRIGLHVGEPINDSNIMTDELAQERADYELRKVSINDLSFSTAVAFNPLLAVNNLVSFTDSFFGLERERMLLKSISFSLDYSGIINITTSNLTNIFK